MKRLPMRESVIRRTTILSGELGAVNLSQGFPDDDTFPELKQLAVEAIAGCYHQYTDPWGSPVLRRAVARKLERFNGIAADPDRNLVITCGATEGMIVAMEALVERGSEVVTFAPMYENYVLQDDVEFHERLLRQAGVAAVPGSVFYPLEARNPKRLRFTFSKSRATMEEAARRLGRWRIA